MNARNGDGRWFHFDTARCVWCLMNPTLQFQYNEFYGKSKAIPTQSVDRYGTHGQFEINGRQYAVRFDHSKSYPFGEQFCVSSPDNFRTVIRTEPIQGMIHGLTAITD